MTKGKTQTIKRATTIVAETPAEINGYSQLLRNYENAVANGGDTTPALTALATAVAYSCINTCIDPQRKRAGERETVSNSGNAPALLEIKRGIGRDLALLENTTTTANKATRTHYNADGDMITEVADRDAENALAKLIGETLTEGIDLVQSATLALLEQTADHAHNGGEWLETPYTIRKLSKRVLIQSDDIAQYKEVETTPIQEVYKAVRATIDSSKAVQTDPRNGYLYIEDFTEDEESGLEVIYHRLKKYSDLGGFDCSGNYTGDRETVDTYNEVLNALNLTDKQLTIVHLRMRGDNTGYQAIASYLGISEGSVRNTLKRIAQKCEKLGFTPAMWAEMTGKNDN